MLSLTPAERLQFLQRQVNAILAIPARAQFAGCRVVALWTCWVQSAADLPMKICCRTPVSWTRAAEFVVRVLNLETLVALTEELAGEKDLAMLPVLRRTLERGSG
jgi:hypothetical protein